MLYPQQPGTYCFHNTINNKVYVGSAKCLYTRITQHIKKQHSNQLLQDSIAKRGLKAYNITYVITETHAEAKMQEQLMLDYLFQNNVPKYNLSPNAYGGAGLNAKVRYALEVNNPDNIYTFKSGKETASFTKVTAGMITKGCKNAKLYNSESGRWLFSDISIDDLKDKFNSLTKAEIKGFTVTRNKARGFILVNKITREQSQIFYNTSEPKKLGFKVLSGKLCSCLAGNRLSVNGYYVTLCL